MVHNECSKTNHTRESVLTLKDVQKTNDVAGSVSNRKHTTHLPTIYDKPIAIMHNGSEHLKE